jgi:hypothetical protein
MFKMLSTFLCFLFGLIRRAQAGIESLSFRLAVKVFIERGQERRSGFGLGFRGGLGLGLYIAT